MYYIKEWIICSGHIKEDVPMLPVGFKGDFR